MILRILRFIKRMINLWLQSVFGFSFVCRQQESCSHYLERKITEKGFIFGFLSGSWRIITCGIKKY